MIDITTDAMLTCPHCGHVQHETMPTGAWLFFCECRNCQALLRPKRKASQ
jgi:ribosomal protein L37AE/L43A